MLLEVVTRRSPHPSSTPRQTAMPSFQAAMVQHHCLLELPPPATHAAVTPQETPSAPFGYHTAQPRRQRPVSSVFVGSMPARGAGGGAGAGMLRQGVAHASSTSVLFTRQHTTTATGAPSSSHQGRFGARSGGHGGGSAAAYARGRRPRTPLLSGMMASSAGPSHGWMQQ